MASTVAPTIKLYSSIICPGSHRVKIVLDQLGLPYTNEDIDLSKPRSSEYLRVNPRGQTPTLEYNGTILRESAPTVWFLADSHPGTLAAPSNTPGAPLLRHRIAFLESTWSLYVWEPLSKGWMQATDEAGVPFVENAMEGIAKEIEPLLVDAKPYFAGSATLTMAEVLVAPTLIQMQSFTPHKYLDELESMAPNFYSWSQLLLNNEALTKYFDEERYMTMARALQDKIRGGGKTGNRGVDRLTE